MAETAIEWAHDTLNFASGCTEARRPDGSMDPACVNCYARLMSARCASMGQALYEGAAVRHGNAATWTGDLRWDPDLLDRRIDAIRSGRVTFLGSMTDLWHERADPAMWAALAKAARRISARPAKRWPRGVVTLTKRTDGLLVFQREHFPEGLPAWWWPGCTVADQKGADLRLDDLCDVRASGPLVVSYEPAMGLVDFGPWLGLECNHEDADVEWDTNAVNCRRCDERNLIGWLIAGCESGSKRRPSDAAWFRAARDACVRAGVPFFYKQAVVSVVTGTPELDGQTWTQVPGATP